MDGKDNPDPQDDEVQDNTPDTDDEGGEGAEPDPDADEGDEGEGTGGGPDDDQDDGDDERGEGDEPDPGVNSKSRSASRVQKLANATKSERERAEKAERDAAELRRQLNEVNNSRRTQDDQAEIDRIALMAPDERAQYEASKTLTNLQRQVAATQFQMVDMADRQTFQSKAASHPTRARLAPKVEEALTGMRAKGMTAPRDDIYYYLLGKELDAREQKNKGKPAAKSQPAQNREDASRRVASVRSQPTSARSDSGSRKGTKSLEEKLDGVLI